MRKRHTTSHPGIRYRLLDEARPDGPRRYIIGYTDAQGRYHTETLGVGYTLADAKARKAALEGVKRTIVPTYLTVRECMDTYLRSRRSSLAPATYESYRYGYAVVNEFCGSKKIRDLTTNDVAALIAQLKDEGKKAWTIKKILTPLVGALKVALREGWIQSNPADHLLPHERPKADQKEMRCLSLDEINALVKHAASDRWKLLFQLLAFTGMRISEALALTWEDIGHDEIRVRGTKTKAADRTVMLIPTLRQRLFQYRLSTGRREGLVFLTRSGKPVLRHDALRALRTAEEKAGLPDYTLHELRHTFASILISQGESVVLVADQMGHAHPGVTLKVYAKLFDAQKNIAAARERLQATMGG